MGHASHREGRPKPMNLQLPKIRTREDLVQAYQEVVQAAAEGRITSEQAERMAPVLVSGEKFIENDELNLDVQALRKEVQELKEEVHARPSTSPDTKSEEGSL